MYQVLARKYRPKNFSELVGQTHVSRALMGALENGRLHHAYLFTGTRGVGKTTIARILSKCLNCEKGITNNPCGSCGTCTSIDAGQFIDLIEIDAASRTKVEDTRELLDQVPYAPTQGRYKVYLIDEVHMLSTHSFNALLKTLEEPPEHVKFLLATTDPQKLPVTVMSRCLQFVLRPLPKVELHDHLANILSNENIGFDDAALWKLAESARGSVRDSLSLTDQAIAFGQGYVKAEDVDSMLGLIDATKVAQLISDIHSQDKGAVADHIQAMRMQMVDAKQVLDQLVECIYQLALLKDLPELNIGVSEQYQQELQVLASNINAADIQLYYAIASSGRNTLALASNPQQGLEMTILRLLSFQPLTHTQVPETLFAQTTKSVDNSIAENNITADTHTNSQPSPINAENFSSTDSVDEAKKKPSEKNELEVQATSFSDTSHIEQTTSTTADVTQSQSPTSEQLEDSDKGTHALVEPCIQEQLIQEQSLQQSVNEPLAEQAVAEQTVAEPKEVSQAIPQPLAVQQAVAEQPLTQVINNVQVDVVPVQHEAAHPEPVLQNNTQQQTPGIKNTHLENTLAELQSSINKQNQLHKQKEQQAVENYQNKFKPDAVYDDSQSYADQGYDEKSQASMTEPVQYQQSVNAFAQQQNSFESPVVPTEQSIVTEYENPNTYADNERTHATSSVTAHREADNSSFDAISETTTESQISSEVESVTESAIEGSARSSFATPIADTEVVHTQEPNNVSAIEQSEQQLTQLRAETPTYQPVDLSGNITIYNDPRDELQPNSIELSGEWTIEKWDYWLYASDLAPHLHNIAKKGYVIGTINGSSEYHYPEIIETVVSEFFDALDAAMRKHFPNQVTVAKPFAKISKTPERNQEQRIVKAQQCAEIAVPKIPFVEQLIHKFDAQVHDTKLCIPGK